MPRTQQVKITCPRCQQPFVSDITTIVEADDEALAARLRLMSLHGLSRDAWDRYRTGGTWDYRIVAPTEWTFHPDGAFPRGLVGAPGHELAQRVQLHVAALDPCVPCAITLRDADAADAAGPGALVTCCTNCPATV